MRAPAAHRRIGTWHRAFAHRHLRRLQLHAAVARAYGRHRHVLARGDVDLPFAHGRPGAFHAHLRRTQGYLRHRHRLRGRRLDAPLAYLHLRHRRFHRRDLGRRQGADRRRPLHHRRNRTLAHLRLPRRYRRRFHGGRRQHEIAGRLRHFGDLQRLFGRRIRRRPGHVHRHRGGGRAGDAVLWRRRHGLRRRGGGRSFDRTALHCRRTGRRLRAGRLRRTAAFVLRRAAADVFHLHALAFLHAGFGYVAAHQRHPDQQHGEQQVQGHAAQRGEPVDTALVARRRIVAAPAEQVQQRPPERQAAGAATGTGTGPRRRRSGRIGTGERHAPGRRPAAQPGAPAIRKACAAIVQDAGLAPGSQQFDQVGNRRHRHAAVAQPAPPRGM
ncbi:hypothetical protein [Stenotrophomonas nitritireducens]|uniref:hypothetical protein n=1 Tax=Stenotrophomonas nitritireducens TaxID=83617 RepID=UPI003D99F76F